nr:Fur family transcriptional regulator [Paraburkholderia sp. SG-MS1]
MRCHYVHEHSPNPGTSRLAAHVPTCAGAGVLSAACPRTLQRQQLYKRLNEDMRNLSLGTLYRALGLLVDAKLLSSMAFGDGRLVYELNDGKRHDHLVCTACGCIHEFFDAQIEARQKAVADDLEFDVSERQLVVFGLCAECRKAEVRVKTVVRQ